MYMKDLSETSVMFTSNLSKKKFAADFQGAGVTVNLSTASTVPSVEVRPQKKLQIFFFRPSLRLHISATVCIFIYYIYEFPPSSIGPEKRRKKDKKEELMINDSTACKYAPFIKNFVYIPFPPSL